jgi:hypothetical protein
MENGDDRENFIAQIRAQHERVRVLSNLIPITERQLARTPTDDPYFNQLQNTLSNYRTEYRDVVGRDYEVPKKQGDSDSRR